MSDSNPRELLRQLYDAAVTRALPHECMKPFMPKIVDMARARQVKNGRVVVLGAGKAGGAMAHAMEALWPADLPLEGLVVTRYAHTPPRPEGLAQRIEIVEASHPVPDDSGMNAARRILELATSLDENDIAVCLISGGGSSLLTLPAAGLTLADKQKINEQLLSSGASISEMNCVRKHLSQIKGGRLAAACAPAKVITLTISDVPGDDPSIIASGPTVEDASTCADAIALLKRYGIDVPADAMSALDTGALETPKAGSIAPSEVHMIATPAQALQAAAELAKSMGIRAYVLSDRIEGESRDIGAMHAALAIDALEAKNGFSAFEAPCVLLSGGETTVTIKPRQPGAAKGRGGRAGEFCLGFAKAMEGRDGVYALAADTDGIDGVEDNAGALVIPDTLARAAAIGLKIDDHLARNDAYGFFQALNDVVVTGPTHTNVNDFRAVWVAKLAAASD